MRVHRRFGRKIKLPSTMAIKHQIRMAMAQYEREKAEADARADVFHGQPSLAALGIEINANAASDRIRQL